MRLVVELKRRGVFQVGVAYTVFAWLLIQVASTILPAFEAPNWVMQAIIFLSLAGFPIALLLAWFYDMTSEGLQRTDESNLCIEESAFPAGTLNYVIISVLTAAVLLFALDKFYWKGEPLTSLPAGQQSVAVLPFENLSGDAANEPFASGIHDDLLTQLSKISALRTISRTTVLRYRDVDLPIPKIAEELGVTTVLEGGVQRSADRIRVNAQLIDGKTDAHLWAETYDRKLTTANIFSIQSDISRAIASALRATLTKNEQQALDVIPTRNLEAYKTYSMARASLDSRSEEDMDNAVRQFELSTESDPEFAAAWAGLCVAHLGLYSKNSDRKDFKSAESACQRALKLDNTLVEVHVALGTLYRYYGQYSKAEVALQVANYAKAQKALEQALVLNGAQVDALIELGQVLARQGRLQEAEQSLLKAQKLEPGSWYAQNSLFSFYYSFSDRADRFKLAAHYAAIGASIRADLTESWNNLGSANYMLGRYDLAADAWKESLRIEPNRTGYTNTGLALYYSKRYQQAARMQEKAVALAPNDHRAMGRLADALRFIDGRSKQATESYQRASDLAQSLLEVNDRDWRTLGQLAVYQAHLQQPKAARQSIARALRFSGRNAETLYYLSQVELQAKQNNRALDALQEAINKDAEYRNLVKIDPDFGAIAKEARFSGLVAD